MSEVCRASLEAARTLPYVPRGASTGWRAGPATSHPLGLRRGDWSSWLTFVHYHEVYLQIGCNLIFLCNTDLSDLSGCPKCAEHHWKQLEPCSRRPEEPARDGELARLHHIYPTTRGSVQASWLYHDCSSVRRRIEDCFNFYNSGEEKAECRDALADFENKVKVERLNARMENKSVSISQTLCEIILNF